jgi:hypothetical protein
MVTLMEIYKGGLRGWSGYFFGSVLYHTATPTLKDI